MRAWVGVTLLLAGCQVYDPARVEPDADGPAVMCELKRPPARPEEPDDGEALDTRMYMLRDAIFNQSGGLWQELGFDLDGICTRPPEPVGPCEPLGTGRPLIDNEEGVDNAFGARIYPFVAAVEDLEGVANESLRLGRGNPIVMVRGWNGTPNDSRITVAIPQVATAVAPAPDGGLPDVEIRASENRAYFTGTDTLAPTPGWDGTDWAFLRRDTFFGGDFDRPLVIDDNAYVRDGVLVARIPQRIQFDFRTDNESGVGLVVRLTDGRITGRIDSQSERLEDVVIAGRWSLTDLLSTLERLGFCPGTVEYELFRSTIEDSVDVRSAPATDGEGLVCDAISLAFGFYGVQARAAEMADPSPDAPARCDMVAADGGSPDAASDVDAGPRTNVDGGMDAGI